MQRITTFWRSGWIGKIVLGTAGLFGLLIVCCVAAVAIAPRTPASTPVAQSFAATQPAVAPQVTAAPQGTEKPTEAPKPTNTPAPTATPKPTGVPTEVPSPTPPPEPVKLSGTGKIVTDKFTPPSGVSRVTFDHQGQSNFIVRVFKENGDEDGLVNVIGNYHGQVLVFGSDPMYFEINADGPWTAVVEAVGRDNASAEQFAGHGDMVSQAFDPVKSGPVPYVLTHNGESNFIVHLYCVGGIDSVANEIGKFEGQVVVRFSDGPCIWEVKADGDWSIKPK